MANIAFTSIVARNYLPYARVLSESLKRYHPEVCIYVLVIDALADEFTDKSEPFIALTLSDLHSPQDIESLQQLERKQLLASKKATVIRYVLDMNYDAVIYLDADILVLDCLDPLIEKVSKHAFSVTPHVGEPKAGGDRFQRGGAAQARSGHLPPGARAAG